MLSKSILSAAIAATLVQRTIQVPQLEADKKTVKRHKETKMPLFSDKQVDVAADEVLDFKEHDDRTITVITTDGKKLRGNIPDELYAKQAEADKAEAQAKADAEASKKSDK